MSSSPKKKAARAAAARVVSAHGAGMAPSPAASLAPFTVALVGRPNVGKSSLWNRLTGTRGAIVHDAPGTTRDWKEGSGRIGALEFVVMDTGGLEDREGRNTIESRMLEHTREALVLADVVLFVIDARAGVSAEDEAFARWVKRLRSRHAAGELHQLGAVHLIANKTEGWGSRPDGEELWDSLLADCYPLGMGEPVGVSSSQGDGLEDLYRLLEPYGRAAAAKLVAAAVGDGGAHRVGGGGDELRGASSSGAGAAGLVPSPGEGSGAEALLAPPARALREGVLGRPLTAANSTVPASLPADAVKRRHVEERLARWADGPIALAVVGRPNAGKSTLVNALLGSERVLAGPTPGLTRDAVAVDLPLPDGRTCRLVDTAGMRRAGAGALTTQLEGAAVGLAKRALQRAHVVALVVDGSAGAPAGLTHERPSFGRRERGEEEEAGAAGRSIEGRERALESARAQSGGGGGGGGGGVTGWALTKQDMVIAEQVLEEGRALVVVINKVDALSARAGVIATAERQLEGMHQGAGVPVVAMSALRGGGVSRLMPAVLRAYDRWNQRISTGRLNTWLRLLARHHPPPATSIPGRTRPGQDGAPTTATRVVPLRLKYLTQTTARPPTFALFSNRKNSAWVWRVRVGVRGADKRAGGASSPAELPSPHPPPQSPKTTRATSSMRCGASLTSAACRCASSCARP